MPRQPHYPWTLEEDQRLADLVETGKSWVLISALLKRSLDQVKARYRLLVRRSAAGEVEQ
jgi:Myb-like DNA-binding domain